MISNITIFHPEYSRYQLLHHFTDMLSQALAKQGITISSFRDAFTSEKILNHLQNNPPDFTLSYNGLLPDETGQFLCDAIKIPHLACLVDAPHNFLPMFKSSHTILGCIDLFHCQFFQAQKPDVLFLPHATDRHITFDSGQERHLNIVMLGSYFDPDKIRKHWKNTYSKELQNIFAHATTLTLSDREKPLISCLLEALLSPDAEVDRQTLNYAELFNDFERYIRALDRTEMIHSLVGYDVHVFGEGGWEGFQKKTKTRLHINPSVNLVEVVEVIKKVRLF